MLHGSPSTLPTQRFSIPSPCTLDQTPNPRTLLPQERLGLAAEHGFFFRAAGGGEWEARFGQADEQAAWKEMTRPILELYTESTDGSNIEAKDSALVRGPYLFV